MEVWGDGMWDVGYGMWNVGVWIYGLRVREVCYTSPGRYANELKYKSELNNVAVVS